MTIDHTNRLRTDGGSERRQCEIGIGNISGGPGPDEIQMGSGMCQADAVGVFEIENQAGSNHLTQLCEHHRDILENGPGMIVGEVELPSDGGEDVDAE